jgi:zinc transporter 1/2/3
MFEGLGIGSRLAYMRLPPRYRYVPILAALAYGITTPLGIAVGLGIRSTYNPDSTTASIVSGILDSSSAGILIYTGLVEVSNAHLSPPNGVDSDVAFFKLLAHEFLFNKEMITGSNGKLIYALSCMLLGCGIMALLGRWA